MDKTRILVSNLSLPYPGVGSWTYEINSFLERNDTFFEFVISPNSSSNSHFIFAEKKKWFPGSKWIRNFALKKWVAGQYIRALKSLAKKGKPLQVLVIDDLSLLEAIASIKGDLPIGSELFFYFHGHLLNLNPELQKQVDLVLFLTELGYLESFANSYQFIPEVKVIGNGVSSELFYPLNPSAKFNLRKQLEFGPEEKIICWMANSRPVKGLHLFGKMIPKLLAIDSRIRIITIGHEPIAAWNKFGVVQLGRLAPKELAKYLQVSDFYFFTSLWKEGFGLSLVEAIKCGNYIFCSDTGGIPAVVKSLSRVSKIKYPNIIQNWIEEFETVINRSEFESNLDSTEFLDEFYSLESWEKRFINALE